MSRSLLFDDDEHDDDADVGDFGGVVAVADCDGGSGGGSGFIVDAAEVNLMGDRFHVSGNYLLSNRRRPPHSVRDLSFKKKKLISAC